MFLKTAAPDRDKKRGGRFMRKTQEKGWTLDLRNTSDEVLLLLAREAHCQPARDELTCRYWHKIKSGFPLWAGSRRLTAWEVEDAHQQAFFWIQEAVRDFDPAQLTLPRGSSFQTFLKRVVRLRLSDFLRSLRRNRQRFRPVEGKADWYDQLLLKKTSALPGRHEELHRQWEHALHLLDSPARVLFQELSDGKRLRDLPEVLGVSYRTLKRRWRKLREQLIVAFRHLKE
jgi:RNA polymerase sigma factor (sigma-70 family)